MAELRLSYGYATATLWLSYGLEDSNHLGESRLHNRASIYSAPSYAAYTLALLLQLSPKLCYSLHCSFALVCLWLSCG